jgi:hypothetical protein
MISSQNVFHLLCGGLVPGAIVLNMAPLTREELVAVRVQARVGHRPSPAGKSNFGGGSARRADSKLQDQTNGAGPDVVGDVPYTRASDKQTVCLQRTPKGLGFCLVLTGVGRVMPVMLDGS